MHSHLDALQAMGPVNLRRLARDFHSVAKQALFYIAVGAHFQGFWKAKWLPKFDFRGFFFDVIFHCVWASNFGRFFEAPNQKNNSFLLRKTMIFAKFVLSIKIRKLLDFAFVFRGQNEENPFKIRIQKRAVLKHRTWRVFPRILGAFWNPKIIKNRKFSKKIDVRRRPL